ncbi:MAG: Holliday junction DNA helicase RuvA [Pirellulaceae bacterium]|nr:Holliday junction DNA helicase RuvA [Pirellulaceae bacterium]
MITKITGNLVRVDDDQAVLQIDAFEYQVLIPEFARRQLQPHLGEPVSLHTIYYLDGNPAHGRLTPRMVGFLKEVEREFFELFCSVDGVGVRKALRAMVRPVQDVADLIEQQDSKGLSALPGIGPAMAERIIAKLRRKMPKFALLVGRDEKYEAEVEMNVVDETFQVLTSLGHSESDARRLLDTALATKRKFKDVESLLQAVYDQRNQ